MCEWTPPYETRPRRWTSPPRSRALRKTSASTSLRANEPSATAWFTPREILDQDPPRPDREMADLRVPHLSGRKANGLAGRRQRRLRIPGDERVENRCVGELDGVSRAGRGDPPAVEDDEADGRQVSPGAGPADRLERLDVERRAADERAVDIGQRQQRRGVLRLHRAAVEHRRSVERLHEGVRLLGDLRCSRLARADRPDRLVGDHEPFVTRDPGYLTLEHRLGLARLALGLGLTDAGDDVESRPRAQPPPGAARSRRSRRTAGAARSARRSLPRRRARGASTATPRP